MVVGTNQTRPLVRLVIPMGDFALCTCPALYFCPMQATGLATDPICALSTPPGVGGIAVIRCSGAGSLKLFQPLFSKDLSSAKTHTVHFGRFAEGEAWIDEGVVTLFLGKASYTGEETLELSCHGSPYIQQRLLQALGGAGFRMAEPGEFTMRAFRNGKLDLSQAEAVADLIAAESQASHQLAMHQLRGGFSDEIQGLREELIHFASMIELELDFSEEDVEFANRDDLKALVESLLSKIKRLMDSFATGVVVKDGVPVAIVGKPNAGKSTLLNALLNEDRAIVSDIPGTTRDTVEDVTNIGGIRFRFIDTAGLRETTDEIEAIGVERSRTKIGEARLVLYLYDPTELDDAQLETELKDIRARLSDGAELIVIRNKTDLASAHPEHLSISAKEGRGLEDLHTALTASISETLSSNNTVVTNARHHAALMAAQTSLMDVLNVLAISITGDFLAIDIRKALHHLGEITGEVTHEDLLDFIFSRFCIGK